MFEWPFIVQYVRFMHDFSSKFYTDHMQGCYSI